MPNSRSPGVAEARQDVAPLVQATVDPGDDDRHVRILTVEALDTLRGGDQGDQTHRVRPRGFHGRDSGRSRVARGQHRVEQDHVPLGDVVRELHVVLDRLECLLIPVEADEPDAGGGDQREHAVEHADAGPKDRADRNLFAGDPLHGRPLEWSGDLHLLRGEVLRRLVGEEKGQLVHELAEELGWRLDVSQHSQLVLDEWVPDLDDALGRSRRAHLYAVKPRKSG